MIRDGCLGPRRPRHVQRVAEMSEFKTSGRARGSGLIKAFGAEAFGIEAPKVFRLLSGPQRIVFQESNPLVIYEGANNCGKIKDE